MAQYLQAVSGAARERSDRVEPVGGSASVGWTDEAGEAAIEVEGLTIRYGELTAVDGITFSAPAGQILALLGPNGAGKTSTVETLEGYRRPDAGRVRVLGLDPVGDHAALTRSMGVMLQGGGVYTGARPPEVLRLFAAFYPDPADPGELLRRVGLEDRARTTWRHLSGGERQRLSLALALVGRPSIVFLDEPTAGIDPAGRRLIRRTVADLRDEGVTVVLTTHDLDEAEALADRVVIIDHGRVLADGPPAALRRGGDEDVLFGAEPGLDTVALAAAVGGPVHEMTPGEYRANVAPTPATVAALTRWLADHDLPLADLRAGRQRLEDVFLRLTDESARAKRPEPVAGSASVAWTDEASSSEASTKRRGKATGKPARRRGGMLAQWRLEVRLSLRQGEQLLVSLGIPVLVLLFFSLVDVVPGRDAAPSRVDDLVPAVLALGIMSTAMVSLGIAAGFERYYGVLKRLGATPLGRPRLITAKIAMVLALEVVQLAVLIPVAALLGWQPGGAVALVVPAYVLGTAAFAGLGLLLAGTLKSTVNLALCNTLYLVLLFFGGIVIPPDRLPGPLGPIAGLLPSGALADVLHGALTPGASVPAASWFVLTMWALAMPAAAAAWFRWE
jgi:ABC-2 type transport system ATP-binding protein